MAHDNTSKMWESERERRARAPLERPISNKSNDATTAAAETDPTDRRRPVAINEAPFIKTG